MTRSFQMQCSRRRFGGCCILLVVDLTLIMKQTMQLILPFVNSQCDRLKLINKTRHLKFKHPFWIARWRMERDAHCWLYAYSIHAGKVRRGRHQEETWWRRTWRRRFSDSASITVVQKDQNWKRTYHNFKTASNANENQSGDDDTEMIVEQLLVEREQHSTSIKKWRDAITLESFRSAKARIIQLEQQIIEQTSNKSE